MRYVTHYEHDSLDPSQRAEGLYEDDDPRAVIAEHVVKLRDILARLDAAVTVEDTECRGSGCTR